MGFSRSTSCLYLPSGDRYKLIRSSVTHPSEDCRLISTDITSAVGSFFVGKIETERLFPFERGTLKCSFGWGMINTSSPKAYMNYELLLHNSSGREDAFATFSHEIIEFKLKEVTRVYRVLINNLIDGYEKLAYQQKEEFIEFIPKLMGVKKNTSSTWNRLSLRLIKLTSVILLVYRLHFSFLPFSFRSIRWLDLFKV